VKAIRAALDAVIKSDLAPPKGITLLSDSQAALRALASSSSKSFLINEIHCLVRQLCGLGVEEVICQWIPAHVGICGNERADELAKTGRNAIADDEVHLADLNAFVAKAVREAAPPALSSTPVVDIVAPRRMTTIITRLRSQHTAGLRFLPSGARSFPVCNRCEEADLTPDHALDCDVHERLQRFGLLTLQEALEQDPVGVAEVVGGSFRMI
jgi:hypothetical protein